MDYAVQLMEELVVGRVQCSGNGENDFVDRLQINVSMHVIRVQFYHIFTCS